MHIPLKQTINKLAKTDSPFQLLFVHDTLAVELYQSNKVDLQQPYSHNEVYIITAGTATFSTMTYEWLSLQVISSL